MRRIFLGTTAALIATLPMSANALSFTVTQFDISDLGDSRSNYDTIRDDTFASVFATEDFEGFDDLGQIGSDETAELETAVGDFTTLSTDSDDDKGSGATAVDQDNSLIDNAERGRNLSIRQDGDGPSNGGRQNTSFTDPTTTNTSSDPMGGFLDNTYIDSNDTLGIEWIAKTEGGDFFDRLLFTITDPADQGGILTIDADGYSDNYTIEDQDNGEIFNILIGFSDPVNLATVSFAKDQTDDGFSMDNFTVGAVPLPAAAWFLLAASGGLVAAKRRQARRAG